MVLCCAKPYNCQNSLNEESVSETFKTSKNRQVFYYKMNFPLLVGWFTKRRKFSNFSYLSAASTLYAITDQNILKYTQKKPFLELVVAISLSFLIRK